MSADRRPFNDNDLRDLQRAETILTEMTREGMVFEDHGTRQLLRRISMWSSGLCRKADEYARGKEHSHRHCNQWTGGAPHDAHVWSEGSVENPELVEYSCEGYARVRGYPFR